MQKRSEVSLFFLYFNRLNLLIKILTTATGNVYVASVIVQLWIRVSLLLTETSSVCVAFTVVTHSVGMSVVDFHSLTGYLNVLGRMA